MKIVFRVDASLEMGTGHVMRCLTLAKELHQKGHSCIFITREHKGNLVPLITKEGFPAHVLPMGSHSQNDDLAHKSWLGATQAEDAQACIPYLSFWQPDWLVVDHYALDYRWEEAMQLHCRHLMVIDDLADRSHTCNLLLDQNLGRPVSDYANLVPRESTILVGPQYALLRPEFSFLRDTSLNRRRGSRFQNILISMGGIDKPNATTRVLEALKKCELPADCQLNVVMGPNSPWIQKVHNTAKTMPCSTTVLVNVANMAVIMATSDLSIGAAGSTSWERCCLGLPSIILVLAENQRFISQELAKAGAAKAIHSDADDFDLQLKEMINHFGFPTHLKETSRRAASICDGMGIQRIRRLLLEK